VIGLTVSDPAAGARSGAAEQAEFHSQLLRMMCVWPEP
jgi:hypothetical protein